MLRIHCTCPLVFVSGLCYVSPRGAGSKAVLWILLRKKVAWGTSEGKKDQTQTRPTRSVIEARGHSFPGSNERIKKPPEKKDWNHVFLACSCVQFVNRPFLYQFGNLISRPSGENECLDKRHWIFDKRRRLYNGVNIETTTRYIQ